MTFEYIDKTLFFNLCLSNRYVTKFVGQAGAYIRYSQNCTSGPTVLIEFFAVQSFLAGAPPLHDQRPQPPLSSYGSDPLAAAGPIPLPPGA